MIELLLAAENTLALGLLDQAERTYRQVLDADPRNGIAAVGLSRVALERGDEAGAVALARAALEIDPENATARRMIDRMEEVAAYRVAHAGAPVPAQPASDAGARSPALAPTAAVTAAPPVPVPPATAEPVETTTPASPTSPAPAPDEPTPTRPGVLRRLLGRT